MNNKFSILLIAVSLLIIGCDGDQGVRGLTGPSGADVGHVADGYHWEADSKGNIVQCLNGYHITRVDDICRNSAGYDIHGYNAGGYDSSGYNSAGKDKDGCTIHEIWHEINQRCDTLNV